jgi:hypothetical protein
VLVLVLSRLPASGGVQWCAAPRPPRPAVCCVLVGLVLGAGCRGVVRGRGRGVRGAGAGCRCVVCTRARWWWYTQDAAARSTRSTQDAARARARAPVPVPVPRVCHMPHPHDATHSPCALRLRWPWLPRRRVLVLLWETPVYTSSPNRHRKTGPGGLQPQSAPSPPPLPPSGTSVSLSAIHQPQALTPPECPSWFGSRLCSKGIDSGSLAHQSAGGILLHCCCCTLLKSSVVDHTSELVTLGILVRPKSRLRRNFQRTVAGPTSGVQSPLCILGGFALQGTPF